MCGQNKNLIYELIALKTQYNEGFLIKCASLKASGLSWISSWSYCYAFSAVNIHQSSVTLECMCFNWPFLCKQERGEKCRIIHRQCPELLTTAAAGVCCGTRWSCSNVKQVFVWVYMSGSYSPDEASQCRSGGIIMIWGGKRGCAA